MSSIAIAIIVSMAAIIGYGSYLIFGPDNQIEETCEAVIKSETGETVDLSPTKDHGKVPEALLQQAPEQQPTPGANGPSDASSMTSIS